MTALIISHVLVLLIFLMCIMRLQFLIRSLRAVSKKSMEGLTVNVDMNSQPFPKAYYGIPMSTHFVLVYEKRSWRFVGAERSRCGEFRKFEVEELPELMREELLKCFESFDC